MQVSDIGEEEWSYIPVGGPLPLGSQRVTAFGAAANLVHPATGYSIARSLREAPRLAREMAGVLRRRLPAPQTARLVWTALWPAEKRRQVSALCRAPLHALPLHARMLLFARPCMHYSLHAPGLDRAPAGLAGREAAPGQHVIYHARFCMHCAALALHARYCRRLAHCAHGPRTTTPNTDHSASPRIALSCK